MDTPVTHFNAETTDKKSLINQKIKELKKLAKLDKDIATLKAKIVKLENEKRELEKRYGI
jgi:predicted  nucleic acid-binding Zn-ribbon protein